MITQYGLNKHYSHYSQWAVQEIEDQVFIDCASLGWNEPKRYIDWINYLEKHLYFVVVTLTPVSSRNPYSGQKGFSADVCAGEFKAYYKNICRHLIGPRWNRKKALQPFAFCSLDAKNSRGSQGQAIYWPTAKNIHINALVLAHPDADPTDKNLDWLASIPKHSRIDSVKVSRYDSDNRSLKTLAQYCTKADRPYSDQTVQLFILPEGKNRDLKSRALQNRANTTSHITQVQCPGGADCPLKHLQPNRVDVSPTTNIEKGEKDDLRTLDDDDWCTFTRNYLDTQRKRNQILKEKFAQLKV